MINIKLIKTHDDAVLPTANNKEPGTGDTGFDLVAVEDAFVPVKGSVVVPVGLTLADITPGYWLRIEPRSGLGFKHNIQPHLGVIDSGYRGDLGVKLYNFSSYGNGYNVTKGDKIAQLVVYPLLQPTFEYTEQITETNRGDKGFGSSDEVMLNDMQDIKEKVSQAKESDAGQLMFLHPQERLKVSSGEYILNPMKIDESDPNIIPNPYNT